MNKKVESNTDNEDRIEEQLKDSLIILENTYYTINILLKEILEKNNPKNNEIAKIVQDELEQIEYEMNRLKAKLEEADSFKKL